MACVKKDKNEEVPVEVVEPVVEPDRIAELTVRVDALEARIAALEALAKPVEVIVDEPDSRYSRVMNFVNNL